MREQVLAAEYITESWNSVSTVSFGLDPNPPRNGLGNNLAQKCLGSWSSTMSVD